VDFEKNILKTDFDDIPFDYLILACGANHSYFGHSEWEEFAPGLKTLDHAMEIRRRILTAFEKAEREKNELKRKKYLTFVVVGGGPTGVELAGAIGEMTRYTLAKDFRSIDTTHTRIILIEAGERILSAFHPDQSSQAIRDLETLGVQVWTSGTVDRVDDIGIMVGDERVEAETVLWAAGISATELNHRLGVELNSLGQIVVEKDLSIKHHTNVFVAGDQAGFTDKDGNTLPCLSSVAIQQGTSIAKNIIRETNHLPGKKFSYFNKGAMATIGRNKAIADIGFLRFHGFTAWFLWLFVHIYFITGFNNRFFIMIKWCISYMTNKKGARIIIDNYCKKADDFDKKEC
jgi:NADH dehydrogenase